MASNFIPSRPTMTATKTKTIENTNPTFPSYLELRKRRKRRERRKRRRSGFDEGIQIHNLSPDDGGGGVDSGGDKARPFLTP